MRLFMYCNVLTMRMSPLNVTSEQSPAGHASEAHSGLGAAKLLFGHLRSRCRLYEGYELPVRIDWGHSKVF